VFIVMCLFLCGRVFVCFLLNFVHEADFILRKNIHPQGSVVCFGNRHRI